MYFYTSLASICFIVTGLGAIVITLIPSLIPVFLSEDHSPYYGSIPFSVSYQLSNGTVAAGSISDSQRDHLHNQLLNLAIKTVSISISSASVVDQTKSTHALVRRQASSQQILQLNGVVQAHEGCLRKCLVDFVKQFKSTLCTTPLTLSQ
ncbi:unnamed protein product [Adineta ricciae]|uniref:Uncharacterized protein n=2 Tax=Adineta ricciae TaxID=249248 RepID=A0A814KKX0_ADIRI|nr:unnamed protein product [Adineta ricciae]